MGIEVEEEHIFTCAMSTARFLAMQKPNGTAFVIGETGLLTELHHNGYAIVDKNPDYVVVGEGRTLNFEMVEAAVGMILAGAKLVATNMDPNCPTQTGTRPGCAPSFPCSRQPQVRKLSALANPVRLCCVPPAKNWD